MKKIIKIIKDDWLVLLFSLLEGFLQVYGFILYLNKGIKNYNILSFLFTIILFIFFYLLNKKIFKLINIKYEKKDEYHFNYKSFLLIWIIIFICWIPILLAYYPTLWTYDVNSQVPHLINGKMTLQHPMLHTLFIELFLFLGNKIKNYEFGMLLLSIVQMIIMSGIFSYGIEKIKTVIGNKKVCYLITVLLIVYFGIVPFNSIMSISMTKDVLFSGFLLLVIIYTYDLLAGDNSIKKQFLFVLLSVLALLFKNNGVFIYSIFLGVIIFTYQKRLVKLSVISLVIFFTIHLSLIAILNPNPVSKYEKLSVVTQNLLYIQKEHPQIMYEDQFIEVMPLDCLVSNTGSYTKNRADASKNKFLFCGLQRDEEFIMKTWLYYGMKYFDDYFDSWSNLTTGSWYLFDESHANVYYNTGYLISCYNKVTGISEKRPASKWPWLFDKLEMISTKNIQYSNATIFRFLFAPATYILLFFLLIIYIIKNKIKKELIPLSLLIALYASILTGPVIIVRYIYPFMVTVPFIFVRLLAKKRES